MHAAAFVVPDAGHTVFIVLNAGDADFSTTVTVIPSGTAVDVVQPAHSIRTYIVGMA